MRIARAAQPSQVPMKRGGMRRATFVPLLLSIGMVLAIPGPVSACSCAAMTQKEAFDSAKAVFMGRALSVEKSGISGGRQHRIVRFAVSDVWKGPHAGEIEVATGMDDADCGFYFAEGETYVVYAHEGSLYGGGLETGICSRTEAARRAQQDLEALGAGERVPPAEPSSWDRVRDNVTISLLTARARSAQAARDAVILGPWYAALAVIALGIAVPIACAFLLLRRRKHRGR